MFTRTVQTIKNLTILVSSFNIPGIKDTIELRKFPRKNNHYILIFKDVMSNKKDWEDVKIISEIQYRNESISFRINLVEQYPWLIDYEYEIKTKVKMILFNRIAGVSIMPNA